MYIHIVYFLTHQKKDPPQNLWWIFFSFGRLLADYHIIFSTIWLEVVPENVVK